MTDTDNLDGFPDDAVCRGSWHFNSACGKCAKCRMQVHNMLAGLLNIAARSEDSSPQDVFGQVAEAFRCSVGELEQMLERKGYRG